MSGLSSRTCATSFSARSPASVLAPTTTPIILRLPNGTSTRMPLSGTGAPAGIR